MINIDDFKKLSIKIGRIKKVEDHPNADKLYVVIVDIGGEDRQVIAGIKQYYKPDELVGKQAVILENMQPATIRGVESQGMLLAAKDDERLSVLIPEREMKEGSLIS
ncbi:MAG: methionine--tRNA ligase subunit beta [Candidatus Omnitrophica bacterium]|nr:methionine--tRNA ligase subunit beta [Candidatus Omnitrophota bacterium]